jgi:hypothetical protein
MEFDAMSTRKGDVAQMKIDLLPDDMYKRRKQRNKPKRQQKNYERQIVRKGPWHGA